MIDLGDVQQLQFSTRDAAGNPADAGGAVTLDVTKPDLTVDSIPIASSASTGEYEHDYPTTQVGRHLVRWVATGANAGAHSDVFDVAPAAPGFILSLADARDALNLPENDTAYDDQIREYAAAVAEVIEDVVGPVIRRSGLTWTVDGYGRSIMLPTSVLAVTSVVENGITLADGDYLVDLTSGIVTRGSELVPLHFLPGQRNVTITYNVGMIVVPERIRNAAKVVLRHQWQSDKNGARPAFGLPDMEVVRTPSGFTMPLGAYQLLMVDDDVPGFA